MAERPCTLVTGGAARIGATIVRACIAAGHDVVVHCRSSRADADGIVAEARAAGVAAAVVEADLADPQAVETVFPRAAEALGRPVTGLVNSASVFAWDDLSTLSAEGFLRHALPNALAPALLIQCLVRQLPEGRQGAVVNILDQKLASPNGDHLSYSLSKYALMGLTEMLARSEAPRLRVNAVSPGYTLPAPGQSDTEFRHLHGRTALGYGPSAEELAKVVLLLLTSPSITGETVHVDAGLRFLHLPRDISYLPVEPPPVSG